MCSCSFKAQFSMKCLLFYPVILELSCITQTKPMMTMVYKGMLCWSSLLPRHQIFCACPAALSENRVWTHSLVKLGCNYMSVSACCRTNQIAQVDYASSQSQSKCYWWLMTAVSKLAPVFVVKVSRPYFFTSLQGARKKFGLGMSLMLNQLWTTLSIVPMPPPSLQ